MPILLAGIPLNWSGEDCANYDSLLAHTKGAILQFFTTKDATVLRSVCRELKNAVAEYTWADEETLVKSRVYSWKTCFPCAVAVNVSGTDVQNEDFQHFAALHSLKMRGCLIVSDCAFSHLRGITKLDMSWCNQTTITDAAFVHLRGIHSLNMSWCSQSTITDAAFKNLRGIHTLHISACNQPTITDAAFMNLRGINTLNMSLCYQGSITGAAFAYLRGFHTLDISYLNQRSINVAAFVYLHGIHELEMSGCPPPILKAARRALLQPKQVRPRIWPVD